MVSKVKSKEMERKVEREEKTKGKREKTVVRDR